MDRSDISKRDRGNTAIYIFPLCVLLVFLVLAAQYESLRLPLAIVLIVPLCLLFALLGVRIDGGDNNIFTQIAFCTPNRSVRSGDLGKDIVVSAINPYAQQSEQ